MYVIDSNANEEPKAPLFIVFQSDILYNYGRGVFCHIPSYMLFLWKRFLSFLDSERR